MKTLLSTKANQILESNPSSSTPVSNAMISLSVKINRRMPQSPLLSLSRTPIKLRRTRNQSPLGNQNKLASQQEEPEDNLSTTLEGLPSRRLVDVLTLHLSKLRTSLTLHDSLLLIHYPFLSTPKTLRLSMVSQASEKPKSVKEISKVASNAHEGRTPTE